MLKNLVYLAAFTTFVVLVWISLSIYHSIKSSTITANVSLQIVPLPPTFDTSVIDGLSKRLQVPVDLSLQIIATKSAQSSISAILQPVQVPTPEVSQPPVPTEVPIAPTQAVASSSPTLPEL